MDIKDSLILIKSKYRIIFQSETIKIEKKLELDWGLLGRPIETRKITTQKDER